MRTRETWISVRRERRALRSGRERARPSKRRIGKANTWRTITVYIYFAYCACVTNVVLNANFMFEKDINLAVIVKD